MQQLFQRLWRHAHRLVCSAVLALLSSGCAAAPRQSEPTGTTNPSAAAEPRAAPPRAAELAADQTANADVRSWFTGEGGWALWNRMRGDPYELDGVQRMLEDRHSRLECSPDEMVEYRGTAVRYYGPVRVSEPFRDRLERFDQVVADVAVEVYGRPPRRIRHMGAYNCRTSRSRTHRLSEHALGNAIDVVGFDFGPASKERTIGPDLPKSLGYPFDVRVVRHWNATKNATVAVHAEFLRQLTERLRERGDVFRSMFGPSHRGHANHFHFDMSPWRYVHL